MKDKVFEAKQALQELNAIIADTKNSTVTNDELVDLGKALYDGVLGFTGIEVETFKFVSSLWEIYSVRGDLKTAVSYYNKVNFDYDGL